MSKAHTARLLVGAMGVILTGLALNTVDGTAALLGSLVLGFVGTAVAAEAAFRRLASEDEIRRDLEHRARDGN